MPSPPRSCDRYSNGESTPIKTAGLRKRRPRPLAAIFACRIVPRPAQRPHRLWRLVRLSDQLRSRAGQADDCNHRFSNPRGKWCRSPHVLYVGVPPSHVAFLHACALRDPVLVVHVGQLPSALLATKIVESPQITRTSQSRFSLYGENCARFLRSALWKPSRLSRPLEGLGHANGTSEFIEQEILSEINYSPSTPTKLKRVRSGPALRQVLGVVLSSTALERDALWGGPYSSAV